MTDGSPRAPTISPTKFIPSASQQQANAAAWRGTTCRRPAPGCIAGPTRSVRPRIPSANVIPASSSAPEPMSTTVSNRASVPARRAIRTTRKSASLIGVRVWRPFRRHGSPSRSRVNSAGKSGMAIGSARCAAGRSSASCTAREAARIRDVVFGQCNLLIQHSLCHDSRGNPCSRHRLLPLVGSPRGHSVSPRHSADNRLADQLGRVAR